MSEYLIENLEHRSGELRLWWAPDSRGYTCDLAKAGRYSKEDAERIARNRADEKIWTVADAVAASVQVVPR